MPTLELWDSFSKRANSTKRPAAAGWTVNAALKEETSLSNPTFILAAIPPIPSAVNYALFEGRYYFVTDIVQQSNHRYELKCKIDVMATYKDAIAAYTTFVERAASSYDALINDSYLSQRQDVSYTASATTPVFGFDPIDMDGMFFIRVISGGGIIGYMLTPGMLKQFIMYMFDDTNFTWDEISDNLTKTFFNPFQYVVSCKWFPFDATLASYSGFRKPRYQPEIIKFGWWEANGTTPIVGGPVSDIDAVISMIPAPITIPQRTYTDFRAYNPGFSQYKLYIPGTGTIDINPQDTEEQLYYSYEVDLFTGTSRFFLSHNAGTDIVAEISGTLGVEVQLGQLKAADPISTALGAAGNIAGMITGGIGGIISGAASLVNTAQNVLQPTPNVLGASGNVSAIRSKPDMQMTLTEYGCASFPLSVAGRPLFQERQLGTLSGFVKCGNASIEISGFSGERDAVNSMLNSGFYME